VGREIEEDGKAARPTAEMKPSDLHNLTVPYDLDWESLSMVPFNERSTILMK